MKKLIILGILCLASLSMYAQRFALLDFQLGTNITEEEADLLTYNFRANFTIDGYRETPRTRINGTIKELGFNRVGMAMQQMLKLGRELEAKLIVFGTINKMMDEYSAEVRALDVSTGLTCATVGDSFGKSDYRSVMEALATQLGKKLSGKAGVAEVKESSPTVYVAKGNQLLKENDALGAVDAYQKALELDPQNGKAALNLGQAQNMAGNVDAAEDAFKIAMGLGEDKAAAQQLSKLYLKKANAAYKSGNFNRAYDDAMTSIDFQPNPIAYKIAANSCTKLDNKKVAVECFQEYLRLSPNAKDAVQIQETIKILRR